MLRHPNPKNSVRLAGTALLAVPVAVLLAYPRTGLAQSAEDLSIDVGACVAIESPEERFACYENQVDAALEDDDGDEGGTAGAKAEAGKLAEGDVAQSSTVVELGESRADDGAEDEQEFFGTIAELRERLPNQYVITLENGHVWYQMTPETYHLRVGHDVRIYPTRWGSSYRLTVAELRGFIQVERVR